MAESSASCYEAAVHGRPVLHDGRWGKATLEVCLAILASARSRSEVRLAHQVPTPDERAEAHLSWLGFAGAAERQGRMEGDRGW